ncbi:MAG: LamG-like jellyroll fold domain-containing protein [Flavisolibacter sp.]
MKFNIYIIAVIAIALGTWSCTKTGAGSGITVNATAPTVTTSDAVGINGTTATISGNVSSDGGSMVMEAGILYSEAPGVDSSDSKVRNYTISGPFTVTVRDLTLLKTYYYRAYAINSSGISYGEEKSFLVPVSGYSASSQVASANLVGYWGFNDSYTDGVSNVAGTPVHPSAISFVQGKIGKAVQVASPGYINTNVASTIAGLKSFTLAYWTMQPTSMVGAPTTYMPFSLNQAGYSWTQTKFFMLFDRPDANNKTLGKIGLMDQWFDKGQVWPGMLNGEWHQTVITFDGNTGALRVYIDGNLLPESNNFAFNPQENFGTADSFTLGGPDDNAHTINGWMNSLSGNLDEFRVFNKVLSVDEIKALYALQSNGY